MGCKPKKSHNWQHSLSSYSLSNKSKAKKSDNWQRSLSSYSLSSKSKAKKSDNRQRRELLSLTSYSLSSKSVAGLFDLETKTVDDLPERGTARTYTVKDEKPSRDCFKAITCCLCVKDWQNYKKFKNVVWNHISVLMMYDGAIQKFPT